MKDFRNIDCCLNCKTFCWWDGDYCCTQHMSIHQYGMSTNGGYIDPAWMNDDINNTMKTAEECEDYEKCEYPRPEIMKPYNSLCELNEQRELYNKFVNNDKD